MYVYMNGYVCSKVEMYVCIYEYICMMECCNVWHCMNSTCKCMNVDMHVGKYVRMYDVVCAHV